MPTPVGHALAGVAAGCLCAGRSGAWRQSFSDRRIMLFACLGILADIDLLFGVHSAYTHSVGATVVVGAAAALLGRERGARFACAAALAYGSHVLLDWLGSDTAPPLGVMALWPFSSEFYFADRYWFASVCREYNDLNCWWRNIRGVAWESLLLGPPVLATLYYLSDRRRRR